MAATGRTDWSNGIAHGCCCRMCTVVASHHHWAVLGSKMKLQLSSVLMSDAPGFAGAGAAPGAACWRLPPLKVANCGGERSRAWRFCCTFTSRKSPCSRARASGRRLRAGHLRHSAAGQPRACPAVFRHDGARVCVAQGAGGGQGQGGGQPAAAPRPQSPVRAPGRLPAGGSTGARRRDHRAARPGAPT